MNPEFRPEEFEGEALLLSDPASPGELPPEQFDLWLDRLIDGEVAEPQRRALLSRLEQSPGGWRRCSLAFLEAQAGRDRPADGRGRPRRTIAGARIIRAISQRGQAATIGSDKVGSRAVCGGWAGRLARTGAAAGRRWSRSGAMAARTSAGDSRRDRA